MDINEKKKHEKTINLRIVHKHTFQKCINRHWVILKDDKSLLGILTDKPRVIFMKSNKTGLNIIVSLKDKKTIL